MNNYVIWYPGGNAEGTAWIEYRLSERLGVPLFDQSEIHCTQYPPILDIYDDRKKIAFIRHESIRLSTTESWYTDMLESDVSCHDYDLVIVYTSEPVDMDWNTYRKEVETQLGTARIVYLIGGHVGDENPDPSICYVQHSFFNFVSCGNRQPEHHGQPTAHKTYLFDALMGTLKVPRLWLYYNLRDSEFYDQTLFSIHPFPNAELNHSNQQAVKNMLPDLVAKYGEVNDYETPELFALEETRIQQFKQKAVTLNDKYSNRRIPDWELGRMPASTLMPWTIYDNSWYSIVSETNPVWNNINFLTEKTAKCLLAQRIFVMFNAPGTLKYLRSLGFQTFHGDIIDESYDDHGDHQVRWSMAWEQVKKLAAMDPVKVYEYYQPVLEFNSKLMQTYSTDELARIADFVYQHKFLSDVFPLHADKTFYRADQNGLPYTSPLHIKNTEYYVWDPHCWWEFNRGIIKGIEFFPNAEISRESNPPSGRLAQQLARDSRKKIAMLFYEKIRRPWTQPNIPFDPETGIADLHLGWADLVIVYTSEQMKDWWPVIYGEVCRQLHTDRIVLMVAGYNNYTDPDPNFIFANHHSFLSYVASGNEFIDVSEQTVPFRKYMFDCLIGTVKPIRLGLFYHLLDSKFADQALINLQPNPHCDPDWKAVEQLVPGKVATHGTIIDYASPALLELEEDVVKQFKISTQNGSAVERYSTRLLDRPGFGLPNNELLMSNIVPWKIYQSSWYSIVCETADAGSSNLFITEKIGKCLFAKRIFILIAGVGILRYLRSLGFRTFHGDIVDESYDDEPNDRLRLNMAWAQIERLHKTDPRFVYAHFRDVLDHNHQIMLGWTDQQLKDISQFLQKRLNYVCSRANYKNVHGLFPK